jgi:ArsR family transcriptional regulator, arsenate/arsenite/antimonite-responsive transcriptional repressor
MPSMPIDTNVLTMLKVVDRVKGCSQVVAPPLPEAEADHLAAVYKALGDPTRVQILHILAAAAEPVCVCDFTAAFALGQPTISHHLARLRDAGIVTSFKRGIWAFYSLDPDMSPVARTAVDLIR